MLLGAAAKQLGVAAHGGERRAQLVRRLGEEAPQGVLGVAAASERPLDLGEHGVQGESQTAHLSARVGALDTARQVAGGDRVGGGRHVVERSHLAAHDPPGQQPQAEQHAEGDDGLDQQQAVLGLGHLGQRHGGDQSVGRDAFLGGQRPKAQRGMTRGRQRQGRLAAGGGRGGGEAGGQGRHRRAAAVAEGDLGEDLPRAVDQAAVRARRQEGCLAGRLCWEVVGQPRALALKLAQHRQGRRLELLVDALEQERLQRQVGHAVGHEQADRDQSDEGEQQAQAQRHRVSPARLAGSSRSRARCG